MLSSLICSVGGAGDRGGEGIGGGDCWINKIDEVKHPSPLCPLCKTEHTTHLFNCTNINTQLQVTELWTAPVEVGTCGLNGGGPPVN